MADDAQPAPAATPKKGGPKAGDVDIGARLRLRRSELNMTQQTLGKQVGVSFQQIQKYERGINRVSGSTLEKIAGILGVPPAYFLAPVVLTHPDPMIGGFGETGQSALTGAPIAEPLDPRILQRSETFDLLRAYYTVADPQQRRKVLETVRTMASLVGDAK